MRVTFVDSETGDEFPIGMAITGGEQVRDVLADAANLLVLRNAAELVERGLGRIIVDGEERSLDYTLPRNVKAIRATAKKSWRL